MKWLILGTGLAWLMTPCDALVAVVGVEEAVIHYLVEQPQQLGVAECKDRTLFLDRTARTRLSAKALEQLAEFLAARGCTVVDLPATAWGDYDYNNLRIYWSKTPGKSFALSASLETTTPSEARLVIRWSTGVYGEEHSIVFRHEQRTWFHAATEDEHRRIVVKF